MSGASVSGRGLQVSLVLVFLAAFVIISLQAQGKRLYQSLRRPKYEETWTVSSANGKLVTTLVASKSRTQVANRMVLVRVWNDSFSAPTLRVKRGDQVLLTLVNMLDEPTNLHFHGLHISPESPADNSLLDIPPGASFTYKFIIPHNHPPGLYFYHSHAIGASAERQMFEGMSAGFIIEGLLEDFPGLRNITERNIFLRDIQLPIPKTHLDSSKPTTRLVNALRMPMMNMRPGEVQMLSIANVGADIFYKLAIRRMNIKHGMDMSNSKIEQENKMPYRMNNRGRQKLYLTAVDGQIVHNLTEHTTYMLGPGSRAQFLFRAPGRESVLVLETLYIDTGIPQRKPMGGMPMNGASFQEDAFVDVGERQHDMPKMLSIDKYPRTTLAFINVKGMMDMEQNAIPSSSSAHLVDLRHYPVAVNRTIIYTEDMAMNKFFINDMMFNSSQINFRVKLGSLERWTIINRGDMLHTFHIHQGQYQVESVNGESIAFNGYEDSSVIPTPRREGRRLVDVPVVVLIPFFERYQLGKYPFHCHIVSHEDNGMMLVLEVVE